MMLLLHESYHYITSCKKNCSFLNIYISFHHNISVLFHFRVEGVFFIFHGVLFGQEIQKN